MLDEHIKRSSTASSRHAGGSIINNKQQELQRRVREKFRADAEQQRVSFTLLKII